jgi:hypothetical protein
VWGGAFLSIKEKRKKKPWNALPSQKRGWKGQIANDHFVSSQTKQWVHRLWMGMRMEADVSYPITYSSKDGWGGVHWGIKVF